MSKQLHSNYVVCVKNDGYEASLELRKIYQMTFDKSAEARQLLRVVDESGEDYLYPEDFFIPITLPEKIESVFTSATNQSS